MPPRAGSAALELVRSCHPEAVAAVTVLSGLLALVAGRGLGTLWVVSAILAGQLFIGWSNDYLDAGLDSKQERADKPVAAGRISRRAVGTAAIVALAACVPLSLASGVAAGLVHLAAVASATAYNLGLKTTIASVIPYAASFGLVPSFITLGLPSGRPAALWATLAAALIGSAGHFTQTLPDLARDEASGVRGLPHRLGSSGSAITCALLLAAAAGAVALGPGHPDQIQVAVLAVAVLAAAGILLAALRGRTRLAFRLTLLAAALVVADFVVGGRSLS